MSNKILSIFIDESGDFGPFSPHSPYYLVSIIFHNQSSSIDSELLALEHHLRYLNFGSHNIHTAPLIRRESSYKFFSLPIRKALFNALYHFTRKINIHYLCPIITKTLHNCETKKTLFEEVYQKIHRTIDEHYNYISQFDSIIIYYDNGQTELTKILTSIFNSLFINVEFRHIEPANYRLAQVADLICTLELLEYKSSHKNLSQSELDFFGSPRDFYRNYYRQIHSKKL